MPIFQRMAKRFQSTHPRRVRHLSKERPNGGITFQSTHPRRVRLAGCRRICRFAKFQSTHPRRVRHLDFSGVQYQKMFQSTHPRRVRQRHDRRMARDLCFNPRTHVGCDAGRYTSRFLQDSFNPRTHVGCDYEADKENVACELFQSTHPRRVRQELFCDFVAFNGVSIHAPT